LSYLNGKGTIEMNEQVPGRELPKEYREIAVDLVRNQGWRYRYGKGHPTLYPADKTQVPLIVPTTPSDNRSFKNFVADVRRRGGIWPPKGSGRR
jgi:hypothetical protein